MTGALPVDTNPQSADRSQATMREHGPLRSSSASSGQENVSYQQRLDRNGKPLVKGGRGWRDASVGSPPHYKIKLGPTLGLGTHAKNCMKWGKERYELEQRKANRRVRGGLEERHQAWKERVRGDSCEKIHPGHQSTKTAAPVQEIPTGGTEPAPQAYTYHTRSHQGSIRGGKSHTSADSTRSQSTHYTETSYPTCKRTRGGRHVEEHERAEAGGAERK